MPTMIRTGLTHSVCKPDCLPLDTAYEIVPSTGNVDYYSSCITTENVIHAFINDWNVANRLYHYYSDNDGKDWNRELIYSAPVDCQIDFAACDIDPATNTIYLAISCRDNGATTHYFRLMKATKTGPYAWTWGADTEIATGLTWHLDDSMCSLHFIDSNNYRLCMGGMWLFTYYSPKWWYTTDAGATWNEEASGVDGKLLASYRLSDGTIINVKGHL